MKVYAVTPALNEEQNLRQVLPDLARALHAAGYAFQICVVDDGSKDDTAAVCKELAAELPVCVQSHPRNLGVGAAFRTGFRWALTLANNEDAIVTLEADNTADLSILPCMLGRLRDGADLVLASCYAPGGYVIGTTVARRLLSHGANLLLRRAFSLGGIHTYSAFYRGYRARLLRQAEQAYGGRLVECSGFVCMVEVPVKLHTLTGAIVEVPTSLRADLRAGRSKMRVLRTIWGYLRFIWQAARHWGLGRGDRRRRLQARYRPGLPPTGQPAQSNAPTCT